jgi:hypothetical protein
MVMSLDSWLTRGLITPSTEPVEWLAFIQPCSHHNFPNGNYKVRFLDGNIGCPLGIGKDQGIGQTLDIMPAYRTDGKEYKNLKRQILVMWILLKK